MNHDRSSEYLKDVQNICQNTNSLVILRQVVVFWQFAKTPTGVLANRSLLLLFQPNLLSFPQVHSLTLKFILFNFQGLLRMESIISSSSYSRTILQSSLSNVLPPYYFLNIVFQCHSALFHTSPCSPLSPSNAHKQQRTQAVKNPQPTLPAPTK